MSIPTSMLAARCLSYNSSPLLSVVRIPIPKPAPHEILIQITAAALCHTDIGMCLGHKQNEGSRLPQTAGHEPCGYIVELGRDVKGFEVGERVGFVNHAGACGTCEECAAGRNVYCLSVNTKLRGVNTDGCFSEYALGDALFTFKLPSRLSDVSAAPLMCAGVTAYAGLESVKLTSNQWLAVVGCGGLGHLMVQFAKAKGLNVLAVDVRDSALTLAVSLGADLTLNSSSSSTTEERAKIMALTNGGVHASILLAESEAACELAADLTRKHGTVCLIAVPPTPWKISPLYLVHKDIRFTGTLLANPQTCRDMLAFVDEKNIQIHTKAYPFSKVNEMIEEALKGETDGRLVLTF